MTAIIDTLKDENGNTVYPQTKTNAVLDGNGNNVDEVLENKIDKTTTPLILYGTHSDGSQREMSYSSSGNAWSMAQRDGEGNVAMNATLFNTTVKKYAKDFWNNSGDDRYCHIGVLSASWSNNIFAGRIYTHRGYGSDNNQEIIDFNVTIQNNEEIRGYAISTRNYDAGGECKMYFVKTSNSWEWDVILKMHAWSSAIVEINLSTGGSPNNFIFTFDSSSDNFVGWPDNSQLTITPRRLNLTNYQAAIDGATGWNSGYVDIPMADKILRIQYGQENPNDNGNKRINFPQAYDTILFGMGVLTGTVDVQSQRAAVTGLSNTYIEFGQTSNNNQYVRWIAIGIKNY